jgi:hypothetical protein
VGFVLCDPTHFQFSNFAFRSNPPGPGAPSLRGWFMQGWVSVFTDWPEGQSNEYGEYRTSQASKRTTQGGLLQPTQRPPPGKATV